MAPNNVKHPVMKMSKKVKPVEGTSKREDFETKDVVVDTSDDTVAKVKERQVAETNESEKESPTREPETNEDDSTDGELQGVETTCEPETREVDSTDGEIKSQGNTITPGTVVEVCMQVLRFREGKYLTAQEVYDATDVWTIRAANPVQSVSYVLRNLAKGKKIQRRKDKQKVSYSVLNDENTGTVGAMNRDAQAEGNITDLTNEEVVLTVLYFNQDRYLTAEQVYNATDMWKLTSEIPVASVARILRKLCTKGKAIMKQKERIGAYKIESGVSFSLVKCTLPEESK